MSERHLRSHLHEVPHVYIGGRVVIPVDAARDWLKRQAAQQTDDVDKVVDEVLQDVLK